MIQAFITELTKSLNQLTEHIFSEIRGRMKERGAVRFTLDFFSMIFAEFIEKYLFKSNFYNQDTEPPLVLCSAKNEDLGTGNTPRKGHGSVLIL